VGKGRKERLCPIRATTARLIRDQLREQGGDQPVRAEMPLFVGARGNALTRHGVLRVVQRHVRRASHTRPTLKAKRVGAHTWRHAAAIHLLRSGNALPVVRSWLGHVSVVTTDHYTEIDLETKRRALEATQPVPALPHRASWKKNPDLLAWQEAL
jgi:site-specific recombinase XerD